MRVLRLSPLRAAFVAQVLLASSCSGARGPSVSARAVALEVLSGNGQSGPVGIELPAPLVVRALDEGGRPVSGQVVNFRVVTGGGSVFAAGSRPTGGSVRSVSPESTGDSTSVEFD